MLQVLLGKWIAKKGGVAVLLLIGNLIVKTTKSKKDAARFLDLTYVEFKKLLRKYEVEDYFKDV